MSPFQLVQDAYSLEIRSRMRPGMRVLLGALGLFPLLAPYELLIQIDWQYYLHPFFFLAAFISAGATALSALLFFAAVAGLNSQIVVDRRALTLSYAYEAPVVRRGRRVYPLSSVTGVEVGARDWSDGAPTYHLRIVMDDGTVIESGSSWSQDEVRSIREQVDAFLNESRSSAAAQDAADATASGA
jgi:hypothetical protein